MILRGEELGGNSTVTKVPGMSPFEPIVTIPSHYFVLWLFHLFVLSQHTYETKILENSSLQKITYIAPGQSSSSAVKLPMFFISPTFTTLFKLNPIAIIDQFTGGVKRQNWILYIEITLNEAWFDQIPKLI